MINYDFSYSVTTVGHNDKRLNNKQIANLVTGWIVLTKLSIALGRMELKIVSVMQETEFDVDPNFSLPQI